MECILMSHRKRCGYGKRRSMTEGHLCNQSNISTHFNSVEFYFHSTFSEWMILVKISLLLYVFSVGFLLECKLVHLLLETVWRFLRNTAIELPNYALPRNSTLGIYPNIKTLIWKYMCTPKFIAALWTIADMNEEIIQVLINGWLD